MAGLGWSRRWLLYGAMCRPNAAPSTSNRNLLAHAPQRLHDEVSVDYNDMIYAASPAEIEQRRRAFLRKWRLWNSAWKSDPAVGVISVE